MYAIGGWAWLIWGFCLPTMTLAHATFAINTVNHLFGTRRFDTPDDSTNNALTALFAVGEGWHNNHHRYQRAARNGFYWWELDFSYYVIWTMAKLGLAWEVQPVPERIYREARLGAAPATGDEETVSAPGAPLPFSAPDTPRHRGHREFPPRYPARSAELIGSRAAFTAGSSPPSIPIVTANRIPTPSAAGAMRNAKATSAKFAPPADEVMPLTGSAARQPTTPPASARNGRFEHERDRMLAREKPSARSVPISRVRAETMPYIVFIAPNTAPMPMTTATKPARPSSALDTPPGLAPRRSPARHQLHLHRRIAPQVIVERHDRGGRVIHQPQRHRREGVVAVERGRHHVEIAPDLALEAAALGLEDADHRPAPSLQS